MKHIVVALLACTSFACTRSGGSEDDAYDIVKAKAAKDLACEDITVRKMAQDGTSYEYQATGCSDLYTYGVDCDGSCEIVAGVRGRGLGGLWNTAGKLIDDIAKDLAEADKRQREMGEEHRQMLERSERRMRAVDEHIEQQNERARLMRR